MSTNNTTNISIFECLSSPATTTNAIKKAVFSRYTKAVMMGAESMATATGHTCFIEIEFADGSVERLWVYPQPVQEQTSPFPGLKARKSQPGYSVFTGAYADVIAAAKQNPGAIARANGNKGCWLLLVPNTDTQSLAA